MRMRIQMWVFFTSLWSGALGITCLDAVGDSVDWYAIYKLPRLESSSSWMIREGLAPLYLDVNSPKWTLLQHAINESQQAVYQTLSAVYNGKGEDTMFIMYNDEPPPPAELPVENGGGHTKGVLAFDKNSGFWLIHSAPHFPPVKVQGYAYPKTAYHYGQSFLCVTFPYNQLGNIGKQLLYNQPHIYNYSVPASFSQDYPILSDVLHRKSPPGTSSVLQVKSLGGQEFTSFAKSGKFEADLYDGLVAPTLQQDLLVETWGNGAGGKLDSNCSANYKVLKITSITMQALAVKFSETDDHSKWATSTSVGFRGEQVLRFRELEKWTCIGDINRMLSQFKRGGGTMCLQNTSVWQAYSNTVAGYDKC